MGTQKLSNASVETMLQTKSSFRTDDPDTHLLPANSGFQPHHHPPSKAGSPARLTTSARRVPPPIPPLPGPCPLLFCAAAPGCQGQDPATPAPTTRGTKSGSAPCCPRARVPTTLVGGPAPQPRPPSRRWEPGAGHPRRGPPAGVYLSGQPGHGWRGHLFPGRL